MNITEIEIFPVSEGRLKAYVSMVLNDAFVIRDIKIIDGNNGLFVAMPSRKQKSGKFRDIAHPINKETREKVEKAIFEKYDKSLHQPRENRTYEKKAD